VPVREAPSTCCHNTVAAAGSCAWASAARAIRASIAASQNAEKLLLCIGEAGTNAAQLSCGGMKSCGPQSGANV
jgi:hypothetical protein